MTPPTSPHTCFNCQRTEDEIPVVNWHYRGQPFFVCSACIPTLIHKWEQAVIKLETQRSGEEHD